MEWWKRGFVRKWKSKLTHPLSPSLSKRRSEQHNILVPLFIREGFKVS